MSSIQESTLRQYNKPIELWWNFCRDEKESSFNITANKITQFFTRSDLLKLSYSTLNIYRSALSLLSMNDIGNDPGLQRFFKGLSNQKPQNPKYETIWNPEIVINYLGKLHPNSSITLEQLTKKLVTLLALGTAQRVQTLFLISIDNITFLNNVYQIRIPNRIKTSSRNRPQPFFNIAMLNEHPNICIGDALKSYLDRTSTTRGESKKLFITYKKPYHEATTQTISRWIRDTLKASGIDTSVFSAHSTRHASTSAAERKGVNIEVIRKTAGWSEKSSVFARFYNRPLVSSKDFTSTVINS